MKYKRGFTLSLSAGLLLVAAVSCSDSSDPAADAGQQPDIIELLQASNDPAEGEAQPLPVGGAPHEVQAVLNTYCIQCHGPEEQKGRVRFDTLDQLSAEDRADLLERANEAISFQEMPPEDEPQPTDAERTTLVTWLTGQVQTAGGDDLADKMRYPHYGNLVDHELLFSGTIDEPAYTPARRWLVRPAIFHERVIDVFRYDNRVRRSFATRQFYGVTNPFVLPNHAGVRDYDIGILTGGHLLVMLNNAQWIAGKQIFAAQLEVADDRQAMLDALSSQDRWYPSTTPEAFAAIVQADGAPSDEQMLAAIRQQFDLVLRREASEEEQQRYMQLLRSSVELGGNVEGLKRMLTAVLLESEFLYRLELGGGEVDEHGRRMLTPREGAYAIAYALGDRGPDEALWQAAAEGRLQTREDYEREVRRLLDDDQYYRGMIAPELNGSRLQSTQTSHPRIVRFFREFFGYPAATAVFKDPPRIGDLYQNLRRGSTGTPGRLIIEADRFVAHHVEADEDVFNRLLTSDEYYVYHNLDNETGADWIRQWRTVYDRLRDTDWRNNPEAVLAEHIEFILETSPAMQQTNQNTLRTVENVPQFVRWMMFFEESFGQGRTPFTLHPNTHGYNFTHSALYSLPQTPRPQHYGARNGVADIDEDNPPHFWDYPTQQPFAVENRMGILTHPAWLIAYSTNFHTDPIRRGRWIQEKLLAGRVPDVPITVDAQVPEDPEFSFRHRLEEVTRPDECWRCHQHMNPLGLPFEIYDDFGRYRTLEDLEHPDNLIQASRGYGQMPVYPTVPVDSSGYLRGTGDDTLDGEVDDALQLIARLAQSDRVRQSMIRYAFRFYMGRNETLADAQTLIDADNAYVQSGGSFRAVIVSLLTSDSFLYRVDTEED